MDMSDEYLNLNGTLDWLPQLTSLTSEVRAACYVVFAYLLQANMSAKHNVATIKTVH